MNEFMEQSYSSMQGTNAESLSRYTAKTFGWMFLGLFITFAVAVTGYATDAIYLVGYIPYWNYVLLIAELAVVLFLSARISKMSVLTARCMFFLYALLNGVVFSVYLLVFEMTDLVLVFGATSLFFGIMALIGYFGNVNFSGILPFMTGGLVFLVAFWVIGMFINLEQFEMIACTVGIFIFLLFTAYDTQKIKAYHAQFGSVPEMAAKASIFSALQLYLDFINLFLYILRVVGRRK